MRVGNVVKTFCMQLLGGLRASYEITLRNDIIEIAYDSSTHIGR